MSKNEILNQMADTLSEAIASGGFAPVVRGVFGRNVRIRMPMSEAFLNAPIGVLALSTRPDNAIRRCKFNTVGEVVSAIENGRLGAVKNIGKKSLDEIKTVILVGAFAELTREQQLDVCRSLFELNTIGIAKESAEKKHGKGKYAEL